MLVNRLSWWLEFHRKLLASQFGFRKQRSCINNLTLLYVEIIKGFQEDGAVCAAFLDIQSAYDNVLADILINRLATLGISPLAAKFVYNVVSERQVTRWFGNFKDVRWLYRGLPQGSVFSPLLYTIYVA